MFNNIELGAIHKSADPGPGFLAHFSVDSFTISHFFMEPSSLTMLFLLPGTLRGLLPLPEEWLGSRRSSCASLPLLDVWDKFSSLILLLFLPSSSGMEIFLSLPSAVTLTKKFLPNSFFLFMLVSLSSLAIANASWICLSVEDLWVAITLWVKEGGVDLPGWTSCQCASRGESSCSVSRFLTCSLCLSQCDLWVSPQ